MWPRPRKAKIQGGVHVSHHMYLTTVVFVNIWIPCDLCTASQYMRVLAKEPVREAAGMGGGFTPTCVL